MQLLGLHHVTAITADGRANHDFYAGVLGLRLVKKTVNFDRPDSYHLYYGDDAASPASLVTFFEFPGAGRGAAGAGMVHTLVWRVASAASLAFWGERLRTAGRPVELRGDVLASSDPEGLSFELHATAFGPELAARTPGVPGEHALQGLLGVRGGVRNPDASERQLADLPFAGPAPIALLPEDRAGTEGAGTVHHVAWSIPLGAEDEWQQRVAAAGARATEVIDRFYFRSVYFREPSGVLFELATRGPGFTADEELEHLGEKVALPPFLEPYRERIEASLTPLDAPAPMR